MPMFGTPQLDADDLFGDNAKEKSRKKLEELYRLKLKLQEDKLKQEQALEAESYKAFQDQLVSDAEEEKAPIGKADKKKSGNRHDKEIREKRKQTQELVKELDNAHSGGAPDSGLIASGGGNRNKNKGGRLGKKQTHENSKKLDPSKPMDDPVPLMDKDPLKIKREADNNLIYLTVGLGVLFIALNYAS